MSTTKGTRRAIRRSITRACDECGEPYVAQTQRSKFCGATCRVRANRRPSKVGAAKAKQAAGAASRPSQKAKQAGKADGKTPTVLEGATVTQLPIAGGPLDQTSPADPTVEDIVGSLAEQVRKTLTEAKALDTIAGAQAVRIARQIDRGDDSGSAVATLSKELSRLVAEARIEAAPKNRDRVDELSDAVVQKLALVTQ